jgi:hypothetical protein
MSDPASLLILASTGLVGLAAAAAAVLRGWQAWLDLKRVEIARRHPGALRADLAGLRERVRRLETIASGGEA